MNKNTSHLKIGTTLQNGKYVIDGICGQGGFGITYKGLQRDLGVTVAIKEFFVSELCFRDTESNNVCITSPSKVHLVENLRKKFHKEANGLFKLRHKNIVRTIDFFKENDTIYYVMDYINGPSLNKFLKQCPNGVMQEDKALDLFLQLCDALSYIHKKKMLHLDIKPDNILIDEAGLNAYLIDFGLSKQYDEINGENTSEIVGRTAGYSPIEQYENKIQHFEPATDIYALGATYYKMVTGRTPFTPSEILSEHKGNIPGIQHLNNVSRTIIKNCLKVISNERPENIEQLLELLQKTGKESISWRIKKIFHKENATFEPQSYVEIADETELVIPPLLEFVKVSGKIANEERTQTRHNDAQSKGRGKKMQQLFPSKKIYNYLIICLSVVFIALYLFRFINDKAEKIVSIDKEQPTLLISLADSLIACDNVSDMDYADSLVKQVQAMELSEEVEMVHDDILKLKKALFENFMKYGDSEYKVEDYDLAKKFYNSARENATNETQIKQIDEKLKKIEDIE